jgi:hypothetical protein
VGSARASGLGAEVDAFASLPSATAPPAARAEPVRRIEGLETREMLIAARLEGCGASELAAEVLAELVAQARRAGGVPSWRGAGCAPGRGVGWAAVAVRAGPDHALAGGLELPPSLVEQALARGRERAGRRDVLSRSDPLAIAEALARGPAAAGHASVAPLRWQWLEPAVAGRR